jgi:hypothetical protein
MVVSTTISRVEYSGNGSTTVFAYTFRIFADSDLKVYLVDSAGTATLKTLTTNYTVSGAGDASGGNVTMGVAPTSSETLVIERSVAYTQSTDYVESDSFSAETHESALDRNTMLTQQNERDITRSMRLSKGTADTVSVELPAPVASQFILWNSDADGLTTSAGSAVVAADDITVGDAAVSLNTTSGAVLVDSQAGATTIDGHTGVTIQSTNSGNITLDSVADVTLDAAGNDIELKAAGTQFGSLTNSSSDLVIEAKVADKDILLKGTDGSSGITALSLDMSEAGKATFSDAVAVGTSIELGHASDTTIARASSGDITIEGNAVYRAGGTDVPVTDGGTGASSLTDGGVLLGSGTSAITAMAVLADGEIIVGDGTADPVAESGATARTSLGLGTGDSPTFTSVTASTSIIPDAVGGADIGSTSAEWGDVYIADDKAIKLGNDQDFTIEYDEDGIDTTRVVAATGLSMSPHGTSSGNTTELRFLELAANGNNYAGFKAPDSITGTSVYVLPAAYPASNKLLQSTDAGVLTWEAAAGSFALSATDVLDFGASTLTLSSGAVTGTGSRHVIAAQSGTTDNFDTLATTNYSAGSLVFITADAGDIIHVTNAGNFSETWVLSETEPATFMLIGSTWYQLDRKINASLAENGGFTVAQRGATITSPTGTNVTLDRWKYSDQAGAGRVTITQSTTVPNNDFANSLKIDVTTADTSIAAGDLYRIYQYGLGLDCGHIAAGAAGAKDITISFWWRSDSSDLSYPAIFCGTFGNGSENRVYPFEFSQTTNATWQFHVVTIPGDTTGTWVRTNAKSCYMAINLAVGTDWHGTNKTWSANYDYSTSNQVNGMNHVNNDFYLAGYKAEIGPIATPFDHRPYADELEICLLYFVRENLENSLHFINGLMYSTTAGRFLWRFPRPMRADPTFGSSTVSNFEVFQGTGKAVSNLVAQDVNQEMMALDATCASSTEDVAAQLRANTTGQYVTASAEL